MSEEAQLKIHMMGKISAEYNGKSLPVGTALSGRVLQLFLSLLYYHDSGISREELLDMMYGSGEYANPAGSLRAVVFRLRRIMEECLPAGEHIQTEGGVYRWVSKSVSVYVDARDFQATAEKGLEKENEEELLRACGLYQGEFLAQLAGEKWVTIVSVRCQELYFRCLRSLSRQMQENREYQSLLNIVNNACQLYPYEECQIMKMDCLIAMKRFREAMQVYKWVVRQYFEEQGLPPSEKMLERFRTMSSQIRYTTDMLKDVRESLKERDAVNGPYYCSYPSFIDSYRLLNRLSERISFEKVLICIFFVDIRGKALDDGNDLLKEASSQLRKAVGISLRKGDLFTCYSPSQYLILLSGADQEECQNIFQRIEQNLRCWEDWRRIRLKYEVLSQV